MPRRFQFNLMLVFLVVLLVGALLALWVKETAPIYRRARQRNSSVTDQSR